MARSNKSSHSRNARKSVTIDLEASAVEDVAQSDGDAEPVAFENLTENATDVIDSVSSETESAPDNSVEEETISSKPQASTLGSTPATNVTGSSLKGGVIGGMLALIGAGGLQWAGLLPTLGGSAPEQQQVDVGPLQSEIAALKAEIETVKESAFGVQVNVPEAVTAAITSAQKSSTEAMTAVSALNSKVTEIEASISAGGAGENAGLETLAKRLDGVENAIASAPAAEPIDMSTALAPINDAVSGMATKLTDLEASVDARFNSVDARMAENEVALAKEGTSGTSVAAAIAAAGLKSAVDRGGSFMTELEAYASVSDKPEIINELRNYAASGVPTLNQLTDQFPAVANAIVATGEGLGAEASMTDRLMASARSLVKVRPIGEVEGEAPGAIAARAEAKLKSGDFNAALAELDTLPTASKDVAASFVASVQARQAVDSLVANALTGAIASTAPAAN